VEERFQALEEQRNSFGLYFWGVFTFYDHAPSSESEETSQDPKEKTKEFLNEASEKHYVRATQFMFDKNLWDKEEEGKKHLITKSIFETRQLEILMPHQIIFQHISTHESSGSTSMKDITTFKKLLDLLPGEIERHKQIFFWWAKDLTYRLTLSKQRDSISLPATLLLSSTFASSLVLWVNCKSNLDKGNSEGEPDNMAIGFTQGIAAATGMIAAVANAPITLNLWYSIACHSLDDRWTWPHKVPLLPSFYSNEEITKQSYLIVLYGILYNKEKLAKIKAVNSSAFKDYIEKLRKLTLSNRENLVEEEILELSVSTQYMEKLRKLILFSYQDNDEALSTVITKKEEKDFDI
jgi:hypothetical protein